MLQKLKGVSLSWTSTLIIAGIGFTVVLFLTNRADTSSEKLSKTTQNEEISSVVSKVGDTQYIDMSARGGYTPNNISAKANTETVLRVKTSNTFDCSSAIVIPGLNYQNNLPATGITEIKIPPQSQNSTLRGSCSMGMYRFSIKFI